MANPPGTPKPKTAAPAQFDMNSRERKGGKGGPGGPGGPGRGGRDEKRPPSRIVSVPPTVVDRGEGWVIKKASKIDQASHVVAGTEYQLIFEGHEPMMFDYLGAARDRAKEAPPEKAPVAEVVEAAEVVEVVEVVEATTDPTEEPTAAAAPAGPV